MEASDEEAGMAEPESDHLPLGTSFRDDETCKTPDVFSKITEYHSQLILNNDNDRSAR